MLLFGIPLPPRPKNFGSVVFLWVVDNEKFVLKITARSNVVECKVNEIFRDE